MTLPALIIASIVLMAVSCSVSNDYRSAEIPSRPEGMMKIYSALTSYELEYGHFPNNLTDLVGERALTTEELLISRLDGSLQRPEYFPTARRGSDALLAIDLGQGTGRLIVHLDGSVGAEVKNKKSKQTAPSNGDKPSN